ncbi:tRNA (guanine(26)-N(2))-dimethyltransferase [Candidatus Woesearchaeota archaeon]|nr:tRNA (guanine(26)-N(2))-dimethyltransferase [Candidatus Woesearchaeota archaeon]MCF7900723.1 tRNA (guanine(26)-N(2))-dimethyltransferase [Candidatus Woesearchaeota archaeon]MCF8013244.1 tRNA (guanine(26)-N(2))-dimethyltransferase [Candidatus Woesearchaeota archaeon]
MQKIKEAEVKIIAEKKEVVDKKMPVFYNPLMKLNRDISILIIRNYLEKKEELKEPLVKIADPLAGSGIRTLRILKETQTNKIKEICVNDKKQNYKEYLEKNLEINELTKEQKNKIQIFNKDANIFLLENKPLDYIDIDPFGTPNPFLDAATKSIRTKGILAITATDTSALCGSYPKACERKYWAKPLRNELMHEIGLRILIRKIQLIGINNEVALIPILSYAYDHYMRIFFRADKGKTNIDNILNQHAAFSVQNAEYGPIWTGELNDIKIITEIKKDLENETVSKNIEKRTIKLIEQLYEETKIPGIGFYDLHTEAKGKTGSIPKFETIINKLKEKGYKASRTHFRETAIKTNAEKEDIQKLLE